MNRMDEKAQEANANPEQQEHEDANANPDISDESLEGMSKEEIIQHYKEYRRNSEKGVQKLNAKLKEKGSPEDLEERARAIAQEELDKRYVKRTFDSVSNQLNEEQREAFSEEFKFLTEGRNVDSDNVETYIEKALDLIGWKKDTKIVGMPIGWTIKKESSSKAKEEQRKAAAKSFVEEMWL